MHRWKLSALAAATLVSAALTPTDAAALALGSIQVQSALGENLRAEVSIPQATAAEIASLTAQIASPEVFSAQGMDFGSAARSVQVQVHRKADGTASLRLTSNAPVQDPFVDLVIQTQWNTGHLVRSYTLLLDPPVSQRKAPVSPLAPQVTAAPASAPRSPAAAATPRPRPVTQAEVAAPASTPDSGSTPPEASVSVRSGDTAGRIANAHRPHGVSLDQMLVAMLRTNPKAFINGNVNRMRAGAVLQMPSREQALETSAREARQIVAAQSRDFNAYRRSMATKAPEATVEAADRSSSGQVQAHVDDSRASADTPDKLTLSKGSVQSTSAEEAKLAAQKQSDDQDNRLNELQRNLAELNQLAQNNTATAETATPAVAAATPTATASDAPAPAAADAPAVPATPTLDVANATAAAATTATQASTPTDTAQAPADEASPAAPQTAETAGSTTEAPAAEAAAEPAAAPKPAAEKKPARKLPPPAPVAPPSMMDELLENPLVPAGGGIVALLLGLLGYRAWKRRREAKALHDPAGMAGDSQLQPDSFFGSSGGQQVDTSSADAGGASTMAYSPSQLDGGGDVDPVAEADVYLAYGRDVQAEEILKEALRNQPNRLSIHVKLAEICVKRHDIKGLEAVARGMQGVSQSQDPEWLRVMEMGRNMDPTNTFFAAGTSQGLPSSNFAAALQAAKPETAAPAIATAAVAAAAVSLPDLSASLPDNGIPFDVPAAAQSFPEVPAMPSEADFASIEAPATSFDTLLDLSGPATTQDPPTLVQDTLMDEDSLSGLDLDLSGFDAPAPAPAAAPSASLDADAGLDFDLSAALPVAAPAATVETTPNASHDNGLDFDLGALNLDLGSSPASAADAEPVHNLADDPLSTKLDLAQEFNSIGDSEGARALIEEVLAEASGSLKDRAHKMLSELD